MGIRERLTRRDFLRVAGYTVIGSLSIGTSEFSQKDPVKHIVVPEKGYRVNINEERYEVYANPIGFYFGLQDVAEKEMEIDGLNKLDNFLRRSNLNIGFVNILTGKKRMTHIPSFIPRGSQIIIAGSFLQDYISMSSTPVDRVLADRDIYHELVHVWQEVRDPQDYIREFIRSNGVSTEGGPFARYEFEADGIADEIRAEKIRTRKHNQGRIQEFFTIRKIG